MKLKYDRVADAIYIYLTDHAFGHTKELDSCRRIDYDTEGAPSGIEFLCVSKGVNLRNLPFRNEIERLIADEDGIKVYAWDNR
jgi:uncharacterized protein YuzE